jgi:dTDP-4-amino-4,6-dideoxygalactose transaminase
LITENTKAIVPVHYAGVACDMESLGALAASHGLYVIEDAAHALGGNYKDRPLGSWGELGCFSFHATKNIQSGEGGALCINDRRFIARAEILWEKGTDRAQFHRGQVGSYSWQDLGSSFLPSELVAAFLFGQLEHLSRITDRRRELWEYYHDLLAQLEDDGLVQRPKVPPDCRPNGHIYWLALPDGIDRSRILQALHKAGVHATSHYVPLHQSPAGRRFGRAPLKLPITEDIAGRLIRLPLHTGLTAEDQERVVDALRQSIVTALP